MHIVRRGFKRCCVRLSVFTRDSIML